jgi:signal transduction histidine kinase
MEDYMFYVFDNKLKYEVGDDITIGSSAVDSKEQIKPNTTLEYCSDGFFRTNKEGDFVVLNVNFKKVGIFKKRIEGYTVKCIR